jgi:hypothetical protein
VHWPSLYALRVHCAEEIEWDDGDSVRDIARFECHPVWTAKVSLPDFIEACCLTCGATPQDDGELYRFKLVSDQTPVHHFSGTGRLNDLTVAQQAYYLEHSNMADFTVEPDALRTRVNRLKISARDLDDDYLRNVTLTLEREDLQLRYPIVEQAITVPNMNQSQLRRVGEMFLRLSTDNPNRASFTGWPDSWHVLPGDYVTVTHPVNGWKSQLCRVEEITDQSTRTNPDLRSFTVRRIDGALHDDTSHTVRQLPE